MRQVVTEASLSTRASQWWAGIPFCTAIIVAICSAIYVMELVIGYDTFSQVCLLPYLVLSKFQVYRVFTSVLFHASIFHVVFNMLALVPIGSALERVMGTVRFFHVILLLIISNGIIDVSLAYLAAYNPIHPFPDLSVECGIGFSGVIFALIVIETTMSGTQQRSIFGFFTVPAKLYPWALLFLFQLLMPGVSLLGHLSGILSGFAYTFGMYERALFGPAVYSAVENTSALEFCVRRPGFIVGGSSSSGSLPSFFTGRFRGGSQTFNNWWNGLQSAVSSRRETLTDEVSSTRFPGRGRTLGSSGGGPTSHTNPQERVLNNNSQTHFPARLPIRESSTPSVPDPPPARPTLPTAGQGGGDNAQPVAGPLQSTQVSHTYGEDPALQGLLAMGFGKTKAIHALAASNGDVSLAVEFLSAEGQ